MNQKNARKRLALTKRHSINVFDVSKIDRNEKREIRGFIKGKTRCYYCNVKTNNTNTLMKGKKTIHVCNDCLSEYKN